MTQTRRSFLSHTTMLTAGMFAAHALPFEALCRERRSADIFETKKLRDDAYAILGPGGVILALKKGNSQIIVDCKFAHTAPQLDATLTSIAHTEPGLMINTHHHADHSGGNWKWNATAALIAHKNATPRFEANLPRYQGQARQWLQQINTSGDIEAAKSAEELFKAISELDASAFKPDIEVDETLKHKHDDTTVHLHHYGAGHTDNDLVVHFPDQNIVHMGDLLFHNNYAFIDRSAGATTVGWQRSLKKALALCDADTIVIPGHGEVTDRSGIEDMHRFFDQLRDLVQSARREGKSREEIAATRPIEFLGRGFGQLRGHNFETMFDELEEADS